MKKFIGLAIALVAIIALAGCPRDVSIFEPIVGTWEHSGIVKTGIVYTNDAKVIRTVTALDAVSVVTKGTWKSDSSTITTTWSDDSVTTATYTFSSDNKEMTLVTGVVSLTYTRQ